MSASARSWIAKAAVPVGAGLGLTYAYGTARYRRNARTGYELDDPPRPGTPAFARLIEAATGAPWRTGNRVRILRNGDQTFTAMLEAIAGAKSTIDLSSYIIWPGEITDRFTEGLCERRRVPGELGRGGQRRTRQPSRPRAGALRRRRRPAGHPQRAALRRHPHQSAVLRHHRRRPGPAVDHHRLLRPGRRVPRPAVRGARPGVDVRILTNGPNVDKEVVRETGQRQYGRLLEAGVRIFEYQQTMLHAKVMVADGWASIGSSNLEHRSLGLDDELIVAISDHDLVDEIVHHFHEDLSVAEEFDLDRWRRRSLSKRAREAAGDLLRQSF